MLYNNILKFLGHGWNKSHWQSNNNMDPSPENNNNNLYLIDIRQDPTNGVLIDTHETKQSGTKCCNVINNIYRVIIICIISWSILYALYYDIRNSELALSKNIIYQILFLSQYIISIMYFSEKHLYIKLKNPDTQNAYNKTIKISLVVTIILTFLGAILFNFGFYISVYNKFSCPGMTVLLAIDIFFSMLSFLVNMSTFCVIMMSHKEIIKKYTNNLTENNCNYTKDSDKITREFTEMRNDYTYTIKNTNSIFTILNIFGLLALYITIRNIKKNNFIVLDIVNTVIFIITDTIYIYSIKKVRQYIDLIKKKINSINPQSSQIKNILSEEKENIQNKIYNTVYISLAGTMKNTEILNWMTLKEILSNDWESFNFFGFPITDSLIIQKIFGMLITMLIAQDIIKTF